MALAGSQGLFHRRALAAEPRRIKSISGPIERGERRVSSRRAAQYRLLDTVSSRSIVPAGHCAALTTDKRFGEFVISRGNRSGC